MNTARILRCALLLSVLVPVAAAGFAAARNTTDDKPEEKKPPEGQVRKGPQTDPKTNAGKTDDRKPDRKTADEKEPEEQVKRPAFAVLRYTEDWSTLKDVDLGTTGDIFDRIKFIPLSEDKEVWMSFGGHVRLRAEYWNNFNAGASAPEDSDLFLLSRVFLHTDIHLGPNLRIFLEGKGAFSTRRELAGGHRVIDVDQGDLQNGFIELRLPFADELTASVRFGRQELLFGKQRLVSPLDWTNTRRTFDAVSGQVKFHEWTFTPFAAYAVPVQKYEFNETATTMKFFGIYASGPVSRTPATADVYWLGLNNETAAFNGTAGEERRQTFGVRLWGKIPDTGLDWEVETAYQLGKLGAGHISAFMGTAQIGYTVAESLCKWKPRGYVNFDYASGDDAAGGSVGTFNQLYPLGHAYLGYMDYIGRQNIIDPSVGISFTPLPDLTVAVDGHFFFRASPNDAVYNAAGAVLRAGPPSAGRFVGSELDVLINYKFNRHLTVQLGYSHFFPGEFLRATGAAQQGDFVYSALQFTF